MYTCTYIQYSAKRMNLFDESVSVVVFLLKLHLLSGQFLLEVVHLRCRTLQFLQSSLQPLHAAQQLTVLLGQQVLVEGNLWGWMEEAEMVRMYYT